MICIKYEYIYLYSTYSDEREKQKKEESGFEKQIIHENTSRPILYCIT